MKRTLAAVAVAAVCVSILALAFVVGCEDHKGTAVLNVEPGFVSFASIAGDSLVLTVMDGTNAVSGLRDLSFPLRWSVANGALGSIVSSSGPSAVYVRTAQGGINIVHVRDQYDAEGLVTIQQ